MFAVFNRFDPSYEEAARDLGASPWQVIAHVVLPIIAPSLIGVALFGFTLSYDEFARTLLTAGSYNTLPLEIFRDDHQCDHARDLCPGHAHHCVFVSDDRAVSDSGLADGPAPAKGRIGRWQRHGLTFMTILIINPNSTDAMTRAMTMAARQAQPDLEFEGWTSRNGPASIQGPEDGEAASGPLLDLVDKAPHAKGIIIGCFDDTALGQAAQRVDCPILGIGQAAFHLCVLRQWRFSVVTTLPVSVPVIEENLVRYGLAPFCAKVHASDIPVLALESDPDAAIGPIVETAREAQSADGIDAVILGCAGMVHVVEAVREAVDIPIIDPVEAAATGMGWLTRL